MFCRSPDETIELFSTVAETVLEAGIVAAVTFSGMGSNLDMENIFYQPTLQGKNCFVMPPEILSAFRKFCLV
ncbi:hypothetical protein H5410_023240 [Solanum commersonii]|uniref:Uncharacterized protein n=1 Tax=Solanum commersonii TaxID=4109 RepID=A0A9J5ZIP5_SOLCO|nr:hypothetical protein H5410_023240 [Solanum commersonii]